MSAISVLVISALEYHGQYSLWENTVDWARLKVMGWFE